jgi:hypothetical protein
MQMMYTPKMEAMSFNSFQVQKMDNAESWGILWRRFVRESHMTDKQRSLGDKPERD